MTSPSTYGPGLSLWAKPLIAAPPRVASGFILILVLLDMAGLGVSITVLPSLIGQMAGPKDAGLINGAFVGLWALVQFACAPLLGALADRFGRRPLLILSMVGLGLDYVMMALAPNLWWLSLGRLISGLTASSFSVAYAYVADLTPEERRAAAFGRLGAMSGLGFILGPAVGGMLGAVSLRAPFWAAAAFSLGNALLGILVLPESLPVECRATFRWTAANPLGSLKLLRSHPELSGVSIAHVLAQFAGASIASVYVLYVVRRYGWSVQAVGMSLAFVGVMVALIQGLLLERAVKRLGERLILIIGLAAGVLSLLAFGLAPAGWVMVPAIALFGFWGLQGPATIALASQRVGPDEQGQLNGAFASLTSIADGVGPFLFGGLYTLTAGTGQGPTAGLAFVVAAVVLALAFIPVWRLLRTRPATDREHTDLL